MQFYIHKYPPYCIPIYMGKCINNICADIVSHVCLIYGRIYFKYMSNYMEIYT